MNKDLVLFFDPSEDKVLGVFGKQVHIETHGYPNENSESDFPCILVVSRREYMRIWNLWLDGKKRFCEKSNHYCGVMGYTVAEKFEEIDRIILNKESPDWDDNVEETWNFIEVPTRTFLVKKFEANCDFEHG